MGSIAMAEGLPEGFEIDPHQSTLPEGFEINEPAADKQTQARPSPSSDVAKSLGVGAAEGAVGIAAFPGDIGSLMSQGSNWALQKLGFISPESAAANAALASKFLPPTSADIIRRIQGVTGKFYEPQTTAGEYARTIGQFLPGAIGGPEGVAGRLLARSVVPAIASETAGQAAKGTEAEPYARLFGAIGGASLPGLARMAVTPLPVSPERQAAINALEREGVTSLTAGQRTGSRPLRWQESALSEVPFGGKGAARAGERAQEQFTSATLRRAGINAERATPEVLDHAFDRIGSEFDRLAGSYDAEIRPAVWNRMQYTVNDYLSNVPPSQRAPIVEDIVRDIGDAAINNNGILPGRTYQSLRSRIDRTARAAKADPDRSFALRGIKDALDSAMQRTIARSGNFDDVAAWRDARRQYRNMLVIERAATGAGEAASSGLISPAKLRQATIALQGRRGYARGLGEFSELARSGEQVMTPMPSSGTSERMWALHVPSAMAGAIFGGTPGAALGAMGTLGGTAAAGRTLMSRPVQRYLANQLWAREPIPDRLAPLRNAILARRQSDLEPSYASGGRVNRGRDKKGGGNAQKASQISVGSESPMDVGTNNKNEDGGLKQLPPHDGSISRDDKLAKSEVHYGEGHKGAFCSMCVHYKAYKCSIVAGRIHPKGWCDRFERKGKKSP